MSNTVYTLNSSPDVTEVATQEEADAVLSVVFHRVTDELTNLYKASQNGGDGPNTARVLLAGVSEYLESMGVLHALNVYAKCMRDGVDTQKLPVVDAEKLECEALKAEEVANAGKCRLIDGNVKDLF